MLDTRHRLGVVLVVAASLGFVCISWFAGFFADDFDVVRDVTSELGADGRRTADVLNPAWIALSLLLAAGVLLGRPLPRPWALLAGLAFALSYLGNALVPCDTADCGSTSNLNTLHGYLGVFDVLAGLFFFVAVVMQARRGHSDRTAILLFLAYVAAWVVGGITSLTADWFGLYQRLAELVLLVWLTRATILGSVRDRQLERA